MNNRSTEDQEMIREFLVESEENLSRLDQDLVVLEKRPQDIALLSSIFRTIHTIKGACGFLSFAKLESITHQAENLLSQLRDRKRELNPELVSLILETVDATRKVLAAIEETGEESTTDFGDLTERLRVAAQLAPRSVVPADQASVIATETPAAEQPPEEPAQNTDPIIAAQVATPVHKEQRSGVERRKDEDRRQEGGGRREEDQERHSAAADANIRVGVGLLDKLMDLVGELVLTRNQILQYNNGLEDAALNTTSQRLNLITTELQEGVMKTRMQPIGVVWNKFPRVVRDMAVALGKQIELEMDGAETELDRTIIEAIKDPMMHLIRNSCDHGLEMPDARVRTGKSSVGKISLRAFHEGGQVNIEIGDDGGGIDVVRVKQKAIEKGLLRAEQAEKLSEREAMNLIFHPGFSTAQKVTNISGRGVGMDVVKSHIEKIGGVVDLYSRPGEGTTTKIRIPLTLAIIPGLIVACGGELFVIPQVSLLELIRIEADEVGNHIEFVHGTPVYRRRGTLLPIVYLSHVLKLESKRSAEAVNMVVLQAEDRQFGLIVDVISDTQEIVVKPLGKQLKGLTLYAGATIMGDGRVALILDVLGIAQSSSVFDEKREQGHAQDKQKTSSNRDVQRLLLFSAGSFSRMAIPLSLVSRLEEFPRSAIESASGGLVIQYRGGILPLVSLEQVLDGRESESVEQSDLVQVVVFNDGERSIGMIVDHIVDVVEEVAKVRKKSGRHGVLGSAVVSKKVTDFLDLSSVIEASSGGWEQGTGDHSNCKNILLADGSNFARGMARSSLEMAGFDVVEAVNASEAERLLGQCSFDLIVLSNELPPSGYGALLGKILRHPEWQNIPVIGIAESPERALAAASSQSSCRHWVAKSNKTELAEMAGKLLLASEQCEEIPVCQGEGR